MVHGFRSPCHMEANRTLGCSGWISTSAAPQLSETNSTCFQVDPPSVVLKMPRSLFGTKGLPSAATHTTSGLEGWTRIVAICPALRRPRNFQVLPASLERQMPRPMETLVRILDDPVPTDTMLGCESAPSPVPIEPSGMNASETFINVAPASIVFQTPPPVEP